MTRAALLVGSDDSRGLVTAARCLSRAGWRVGVATPHERSMVAVSRHVARWHELGTDVVASVAGAVIDGGYEVVLPGGDQELFEISEHREDLGCLVPYGSKESVRTILDKMTVEQRMGSGELDVPRTIPATDEELDAVQESSVVKSRSHSEGRSDTVISENIEELKEAADDIRATGAEPVLQERLDGQLVALTVVLAPDQSLRAVLQQRASAQWPLDAGITARARTEPVDARLCEGLVTFLRRIGWHGLLEAQFLDTDDGYLLIDLNGRCYGSIALAAAAGVDLATVWADSASGGPATAPPARVGVQYQWLYGDVRGSWRGGHNPLRPLLAAPRSAHSVWDSRDPRPALAYLGQLARSAVRR
jgi:predicted ATP-grasp superfamily ATP-dependent carboligase